MPADFVHLHVHTEYSMLDGAARVGELFAEAQRLGQPALATTDHGYLFGAYDFWKTAQRYGVKPIIGVEAYLTPGTSRFDRTRVQWGEEGQRGDDVSARGAYTHLTLLSKNNTGMHNLFRMSSLASLDGQWGKWPRMDAELLQTYAQGLIATSGCVSGEVQVRLRLGQWDEAVRAATQMQDIFGRENYYIELMDHGIQIERRAFAELIRLAEHIGAPLLATNDLHYTKKEDAHAQEALLCVNSGSRLSEPAYHQGGDRFAFEGEEFYLKPAAEMRELFRDYPQACDNTLLVAEQCEVTFTEQEGLYMPRFPVPDGEDENSWFIKEVERGLQIRYPSGIPDDVRARAQYESEVIIGKGYPGYFLVVADFIQWAKARGIRTGVRGSGAGSMAAYALRITDLDPIEYKLTFERFLNPERMSMPDFDVDFDERRRGEVLRYVTDKYGEDRVSQIVTYGTIKAKQALKDASRLLDYPFSMGEKLTKAMPPAVMGKDISLTGIFDADDPRHAEAGEFRQLIETDPDAAKVLETARGLENLKRQWGVHAAGVIMASEPLLDIIPIMKRESDGAIITQFDYPTCEALGLVKMDFLGLRNLTILGDSVLNVKANKGIDLDLDALGADPTDEKAYELLSRGETLGVFQLDGGGTRQLLRLMRPKQITDIMATIALYRPGPMGINSHTNYALRRSAQQEVVYPHPEVVDALKPVLEQNYGLVVYQEDVIEIARLLAGYTLGRADMLRRAMGKKKKEVLDAEYVPFEAGMKERGFSDGAVRAIWDALMPFADYGFGKAHAAAYAQVSYWTAYLKANYPAEYMAAVLTSVKDDKDKMAVYLAECRRMGITVLPPDVNASEANFTPVGEEIRFGLTAVRNVGANVVTAIAQARADKGAFHSFTDFLDKVPVAVCNKRTIESLIKAGAFDSLGDSRRSLLLVHEQAVDAVIGVKRKEAEGQFDLFGDMGGADDGVSFAVEVPALPEWDKKQKLTFEREMLGLYVSDHPLAGIEHVLSKAADVPIATLLADEARPDGSTVTVAGLITSVQRKISKQGNAWAAVTIEDMAGSVEVMFFGETYLGYSTALAEDTVVVLRGRLRRRDESLALQAMEMSLPDVSVDDDGPMTVSVAEHRCTTPVVQQLRDILTTHPGVTEVHLRLTSPGQTTLMRLDDTLRVERTPALYGDLKALLGPHCVA